MSSTSTLFDLEMERLDSEIEKTRRQFNSAVLGKKRKIKRTWLEISALTNAHILQMLPYKAMLGHVAKLADERDKLIGEILAAKERSRELEIEEEESEGAIATTRSTPRSSISSQSSLSESDEVKARGRDEAVQTEESSFHNEH